MTIKFLTGFERDTIQQAYECMQCMEPITNPICHNCLSSQIAKWLAFYPSIKKKMLPKLKNYTIEVNNNVVSSIECASCKKNNAALCPYCYVEGVFNILRKSNIDKMVIMDFLSTFNFDAGHEEYYKEIKYG